MRVILHIMGVIEIPKRMLRRCPCPVEERDASTGRSMTPCNQSSLHSLHCLDSDEGCNNLCLQPATYSKLSLFPCHLSDSFDHTTSLHASLNGPAPKFGLV